MSTRTIVRAVLALQKEPLTLRELASDADLTVDGAKLLINRLRSDGYIEFKDWSGPTGGARAARYGWKFT